jgi:hypothetical protein
LILYELQRIKDAGYDPNDALDQSTLKGWCDVFVPQKKDIPKIRGAESADAYVARKAAEQAVSNARVSAPPQAVRDLLAKSRPV